MTLFLLSENSSLNPLEQSMKKIQYEDFDNWIKNFALNLDNVWNEKSSTAQYWLRSGWHALAHRGSGR